MGKGIDEFRKCVICGIVFRCPICVRTYCHRRECQLKYIEFLSTKEIVKINKGGAVMEFKDR